MRIKVIEGKCAGHARCAAVAPDIFELDDNGYIGPEDKIVAPGDEAKAQRGVRACPERALVIVDE